MCELLPDSRIGKTVNLFHRISSGQTSKKYSIGFEEKEKGFWVQKELKCKMCGLPVTVEIDDGYAALKDPHGLYSMMVHDRCADYRDRRQRTIERLRQLSCWIQVRKLDKEQYAKIHDRATKEFNRFVELVAGYRMVEPVYDDQAIESFMENPHRLSSILRHLTFAMRPQPKLL